LQATSYHGNEQIVNLLLEKGADVNAQGGKYGTAFQAAFHCGNEKIINMLVRKGADVNLLAQSSAFDTSKVITFFFST
jgi:ankyrin repeat protein